MSKRLILASNNAKKLRELQALVTPLGVELVTQGSLDIPEAEEPHVTFVENALAKARHAARLGKGPALADDSGLSVDALGGAPGVRSKRWAWAPGLDGLALDAANNEKLARYLVSDFVSNFGAFKGLPGLKGLTYRKLDSVAAGGDPASTYTETVKAGAETIELKWSGLGKPFCFALPPDIA